MSINRISATLSTADQEAVMAAIATIRQKLPFLMDLSAAERSAVSRLGSKTQAFVRKALDIGTQYPDLVSAPVLEEMRKDTQLFESLGPIQLAIELLRKQISDTAVQVGAEAYAAARTVYGATKAPFAKTPLSVAADELGKRFARRPRNGAPAEATPEATSSAAPDIPAPPTV